MKWPEVEEALYELEQSLPNDIQPAEIATWKDVAEMLRAAADRMRRIADTVAGMCAEAVPREAGATVESEGRLFKRTGTASRRGWQTDDLLRAVLDSRLFQPGTGELVEETPVEKILAVWNLGVPRTKALAARGINPDEFSTLEWTNRDVKEITE